MFSSFFPKPKLFLFLSIIYAITMMVIWYYFRREIGAFMGFPFLPEGEEIIVGLPFFTTNYFITFYLYFSFLVVIWAAFWFFFYPHKWEGWSVLGTAFIIFNTFIVVQIGVVISYWNREVYDMIQVALNPDKPSPYTAYDFYQKAQSFFTIVCFYVIVAVINNFFSKHYIFRWRTAINDFYVDNWGKLRHIEGASQRVQEDAMRFSTFLNKLGIDIVEAVMTLFAFLPLLYQLSEYVPALPIIGEIKGSLVWAALFWSIFGTALVALASFKLPGLEFKNQRVEAAYRKELVYGEDDKERATPPTLRELFINIRKNYFRMFLHYTYFNATRAWYLNANVIYPIFILTPSIIAKTLTLGIFTQIRVAFAEVTKSFQYLVQSWPDIIDFLSVYKRLQSFEAAIDGKELVQLDQDYDGREA